MDAGAGMRGDVGRLGTASGLGKDQGSLVRTENRNRSGKSSSLWGEFSSSQRGSRIRMTGMEEEAQGRVETRVAPFDGIREKVSQCSHTNGSQVFPIMAAWTKGKSLVG
jgi:hypothetical protein